MPKYLNENMSFEEMEPYLDYYLSLIINKRWNDADKHTEADKILEIIKEIQESDYSPEEIVFYYQSVGKEEAFRFIDWQDINDITQIEEMMN